MSLQQKITPNLWFDDQAEEAVKLYTRVFKHSSVGDISHYTEEGFEVHQMPAGTVMTIEFILEGQRFIALNGGPLFKFTEAISFIVECDTQDEIDEYWRKLSAGGDPSAQQCGWLKDRFGVSWQIVPAKLPHMLHDHDKAKAQRVMHAMLQMKKLSIKKLEAAYQG